MSVTFYSDCPTEFTLEEEHCLCAQMVEGWMHGATPEALRAEADPNCAQCKGTGVEVVRRTNGPFVNWNEGNARSLFGALGIPFEPIGEVTLPEARRAVIRARARTSLDAFTRPEERVYGRPVERDGVVELRQLRVFGMGLSVEGIGERLERFEAFLREATERGATKISWA